MGAGSVKCKKKEEEEVEGWKESVTDPCGWARLLRAEGCFLQHSSVCRKATIAELHGEEDLALGDGTHQSHQERNK